MPIKRMHINYILMITYGKKEMVGLQGEEERYIQNIFKYLT